MAKRSTGMGSKASVRATPESAQTPVAAQSATQPPVAQSPRKSASAQSQTVDITHEMIAQKAYEIWRSQGGSDLENWLKAERQLRTDPSAWSTGVRAG